MTPSILGMPVGQTHWDPSPESSDTAEPFLGGVMPRCAKRAAESTSYNVTLAMRRRSWSVLAESSSISRSRSTNFSSAGLGEVFTFEDVDVEGSATRLMMLIPQCDYDGAEGYTPQT